MKIPALVPLFVLLVTPHLAGAQGRTTDDCRPASERTGPTGCWIVASETLDELPRVPIFWQLMTYPTRAAAEADRVPGATVIEALDKVWLVTVGPAGAARPGGQRVAEIGPLPVKPGSRYTAHYMEAIFPPGARTPPYTHPGPEAWYHETGGVCVETPKGPSIGMAGDKGLIIAGDVPMQLTVVGPEQRRSIVLILGETGKPAISFDTKWAPKRLCN
jgi:quercetin dioxygenase-like cupin family protein